MILSPTFPDRLSAYCQGHGMIQVIYKLVTALSLFSGPVELSVTCIHVWGKLRDETKLRFSFVFWTVSGK